MAIDIRKYPPRRNDSIELLKFLAALLIANSHMGDLYVHGKFLATGGAIGDAIFFFCSGFTLFLGRQRRFDNYYKRRIRRIYPAIFSWAILTSFLLLNHHEMRYVVLQGGGWFVSCIMVYYIILFFVRKYLMSYLKVLLAVVSFVAMVWFCLMDSTTYHHIYGEGTSRYVFMFVFMLLGAITGMKSSTDRDGKRQQSLFVCISSFAFFVLAFYGWMYISSSLRQSVYWKLQIFSIFIMLGVVMTLWKCCCHEKVKKILDHRVVGSSIRFIGGLCLEIYLVQFSLFTTRWNALFPLNILLMLVIIIFTAYILRCMARMFLQTFSEGDFQWKEVIKMV